MGVDSLCRGVLLGFLVSLLFAGTFCQADDKIVEVVGKGECADCKEKNIQLNHAFSGLHVTIDCKAKNGHFKQTGVGELDEEGKFKVILPKEILDNEDDKEVCYAQLHSASSAPCPAHNGLEATKIVAKSIVDGKHTFEPAEKLKFSTALCTSATLWPYYKYPPLPKIDSWKHHFGHHHFKFPPIYKKKPFPPVSKKPEPPAEPKKPEPPAEPKKPKPSAPKKPEPPSEPKKPKPSAPKKPESPSEPKKPKPSAPKKPKSPSEPKKPKPEAPKKPLPPSEPKKPKPPVAKFPSEKPPVSKKPCPEIPTIPKIPKIPKTIPKIPKIPDIPKIPPKYYHHPKVPYFPPLPPHAPHA